MSKLLLGLLFVGALLSASTLNVSSICTITGGPHPQTGTGGCFDGLSSASASASGGWSVSESVSGPMVAPYDLPTPGPANATTFLALTAGLVASGDTRMTSPQLGVWGGNPAATGTSTLSVSLETTGPQRPGYLEILYPMIENSKTADGAFYGTFSLSMGPVSASCTSGYLTPLADCGPLNYLRPNIIPVVIGTNEPYFLTISGTAFSATGRFDGLDEGSFLSSVSVQFLEADGSTPVPMYEAPEPASWGLLSIAFAGGLLFRRRNTLRRIRELCSKEDNER